MSVSLITPDRMETLVNAVRKTAHLHGDMAELGVYRGGSALEITKACPLKWLHLFDTFTGLPHSESVELDPEGHCPQGRFAADENEVRALLVHRPVIFHVGLFPATTDSFRATRFSFVHVDCDLYQSAKDAIEWFWPRLVPGGIMLFDDYNCKFTGVTQAVDEAFDDITEHEYYNGIKIGCTVQKRSEGST